MIKHEYADIFQQDSTHKDFIIAFDGGTITNNDLHFESIELSESICSENRLRFGCCESSVFKFTVSNIVTPLKNKKITASVVLNGLTEKVFKIGEYKVVSDKPNADRNYRDIVAYDALHDVLHADVATWYRGLTFPMKLKQFRTAFFNYFGIEQEEITLINDDMVVEKTIEPESISGKDVITAICEINGCFGNIGRNGKFRYVILEALNPGLYPDNTLYPQNTLYPRETNANTILKKHYINCEYEDFTTQKISKLQIRQEENDVGAIAGSGTNCYIVQDNFLVYGKSAEDLSKIAENLLSVIRIPEYRPFSATLCGNPCMQVGELVVFTGKREMVQSYILERTLKGLQSLRDTFYASGEEENTEKINSIQNSIIQLKGKTNELTRTVDETKSGIEDVNEELSSEILQTAREIELRVTAEEFESEIGVLSRQISLKVESDEVQSMIDISLEDIVITADQIRLEGYTSINGGFQIFSDGSAMISSTDGEYWCEVGNYGLNVYRINSDFYSGTRDDGFFLYDYYGNTYPFIWYSASEDRFRFGCSGGSIPCYVIGDRLQIARSATVNGYTVITAGNIDSYVSSTVPDDLSVDSISGNDDSSYISMAVGSFAYLFADVLDAFEINLYGESLSDIIADIQDRLSALE